MASFQVADGLATAIYNKIKTTIFNSVYPVGSIYLSCDTTNPSTKFGGTWTRLTGGFIYGSTITRSNTNTNSTGNMGSGTNTNNHTLTVNQIPSHAHTLHAVNKASNGYTPANDNNAEYELNYNQSITYDYPTKGWCNTVAMGATGGGKGHSHAIPYIACSIWKRTA